MKFIFTALLYGSGKVNAANLGYGTAAAWLALSEFNAFITTVAGVVAVFLLGREAVHHYVFSSAWLRHMKYNEAQLNKELADLTEEQMRKGAAPFTEKDVEELRKKLDIDKDDGPGITAGV